MYGKNMLADGLGLVVLVAAHVFLWFISSAININ